MNATTNNRVLLIVLAVLFVALVLLNNLLFSKARVDLTENNIYSLSEGSKRIISSIEEPVVLYYFFSDKTSEGMTGLRNYASRVQSLLEEYALYSDGKIELKVIDPEPFSESEDTASEFGLTGAAIGASGDSLYFGLGGRNAYDDQESIAFFDPQKEAFLEYEISKLVYQLADPEPMKVGVISSLPLTGGQDPMTGQFQQPWTAYSQLTQLYQVESIDSQAETIPDDLSVLMLVHPQNLSDKLLFAIDQFVMKGGNILTFVDPHAESSPMGQGTPNSSNLDKLFKQWGIQYNAEQVVLDAAIGLDIRTQTGGITKHPGYLGIQEQTFDNEDVITAGLEVINSASAGFVELSEASQLQMQPLVSSTNLSSTTTNFSYMITRDPAQLMKSFAATDRQYVIAARFSGPVSSAFSEEVPEGVDKGQLVTNTESAQIIVVADTDMLVDRFWVNTSNFFGQAIATPFANNGDFLANAVENLGGSSDLISVRSRGKFSRPFDVVEELTLIAEQRFRDKETLLQQQLEETERQLLELQGQQREGSALVLSPEQQKAVEDFMQKKLNIRKELRDVRHQLDKDIESLGSWLKLLNIAVMPLVMALGLMFMGSRMRRKEI